MDQQAYDELLAEVQTLQQDLAELVPAVDHVSRVCNDIVPRLVGMIGKCKQMIDQRDVEIARLELVVREKSGVERGEGPAIAVASNSVTKNSRRQVQG
jgi:hypothetical protein